ncbi:TonB-dependent receptor domain-containing protein [Pedobacter xixiisoli]|uniref:Outer membrane receptor proteins, mostly Fe transport n=1 Tax=Pedobacter xixiisoli TaxID=1476464 RepID=A0A286A0L0_9SPHI|nr:TonB-dependent receptor [Pedobacter xixiisoli]SOD15442.1 Outer membrane receptor proteins, mostly Fe transport [Pedobacter xixiisoli]
MKKLLLICAALLMMMNAKAQFPMMGGGNAAPKVTGRISATILDSLTKQPVEYATVSLINTKTSKPVNGALTDAKGKVSIQNIAPGEYKLVVGFIGYTTKNVLVKTTPEKPDNNMGNVFLSGSASTLNEVTIEGKKNVVENKIDRMVYNAEADATNAGGDATDVMRKVPMLSVDMNGNVQLRGSAVRVLINGKPSGTMANSVADALKMIPAEQIKSVEVITNPSAKYEAEGSGGIINIITKKSNAEGVSGSVNASAGTRQNNGNFNLTAKSGRFSANTALGGSFAYPQETKTSFLNTTSSGDVLQNGMSDWKREGFNGSLGLDYDFNAYNNLSTNAKYNRFYNGGPSGSSIFENGVPNGTIVGRSDMGNNNLDWNLDYRKTSKKQGEEFSVAGQLIQGRNTNEFVNDQRDASGAPLRYTESDNVGKNREYTLQTDYVYPFSKTVTWEVGAKGILRNIRSEFAQNSAQDFDYDQNVGAAYSTIAFNLTEKIKFKGGVRGEYTEIGFTNANGVPVKNDYFNLFPSAVLSQTIKGSTTIKLAYNKRVQRPSLAYLNPFLNETNPYSVMQGNPDLDPELSHNVELGYSTFIKGSMINASLFYRNTRNVIENFVTDGDIPGSTLTTYNNIGTTQSFGANVFASYNPTPKWTLMTNVGVNTYEIENKDPNRIGMHEGTYLNYNLFLRSATAFKGGWNLELFGVVNSPRYTFQSKTDPMFFYGGGVKKDIMKKQASLGLNLLNPFNRDLHIKTVSKSGESFGQTSNIYYPLRQISLNFSYKFGKLKFTEKKKIKNDDVKQDQQQGGGMGGMGQGK